MASIKENVKDGKIVSYYIKVSLGRDEHNKQILRRKTWYPESGMSKAKNRKAAAKIASEWEADLKRNLSSQQNYNPPIQLKKQEYLSFSQFVNSIWLPLAVEDGMHRNSTISMYKCMVNIMMPFFADTPLQEITSIQISQYLNWLRKEYRTCCGKPLSEYTIKHHYDILRIIFLYAENNDLIERNPIKKVAPPKVKRKKVDALDKKEAIIFFQALDSCDLEFRCLLLILFTAGLRRGKCLGL